MRKWRTLKQLIIVEAVATWFTVFDILCGYIALAELQIGFRRSGIRGFGENVPERKEIRGIAGIPGGINILETG